MLSECKVDKHEILTRVKMHGIQVASTDGMTRDRECVDVSYAKRGHCCTTRIGKTALADPLACTLIRRVQYG